MNEKKLKETNCRMAQKVFPLISLILVLWIKILKFALPEFLAGFKGRL